MLQHVVILDFVVDIIHHHQTNAVQQHFIGPESTIDLISFTLLIKYLC